MRLLIAGIALVASAAQSCGQNDRTTPASPDPASGVVVGKGGSESKNCPPLLADYCKDSWWIRFQDSQGNDHAVSVSQSVYNACRVDVLHPDRYPQCARNAAGGAR